MRFFESLRRRFRGRDIEPDSRPEAVAEAKRLADDRASIRLSREAGVGTGSSAGTMVPTPDTLRPDRDER